MARPIRLEQPDAVWHVTARGNERKPIFRDQEDCTAFLEVLGGVVARFGWVVHAYVLMPNHYHLVLTTPSPTLSRGMRQLGGVFTQRFNRRWSRCGHLFQGRFFSLHVEKETHLLELVRYTALNPVRARLVESPDDWMWGSYRALAGLEPTPPFLSTEWTWEQFRSRRGSSTRAFQEFVRAKAEYDPWSQVRNQVYLGGESYCREKLSVALGKPHAAGIATRQRCGAGLSATDAWQRLWAAETGHEVPMTSRDVACVLLRDDILATYREIGACMGLTEWGARSAVDRGRKRLREDRQAVEELSQFRRALD